MAIKTRIINKVTRSTITENVVCTNCHHDCHCKDDLHSDEYGICTCEDCKCSAVKHVESTTKDSYEWLDRYNEWKKLTV